MQIESVSAATGALNVSGWAYDPDDLNAAVNVHVYLEDSNGGMMIAGILTANQTRQDVNLIYHCGSNHGFSGNLKLSKIGSYMVHLAALDSQDAGLNLWETYEGGSVTIPADTTPPVISRVTVSNLTETSYTIRIMAADDVGVKAVEVYQSYPGRDSIKRSQATQISEGIWSIVVSRTDASGIHFSQIGVSDYQGNTAGLVDVYHNNTLVTLNADGGICEMPSVKITAAWINGSTTATYGQLPIPERSDYNFDGWYSAATGGVKIQRTSKVIALENHMLYARWTAKQRLTLPAGIKTIEEQAFAGIAAEVIEIPEGCTSIESEAFLNCKALVKLYIPASVNQIAFDAFVGCDNLVIYAPEGSTAIKLAKRLSIAYEITE